MKVVIDISDADYKSITEDYISYTDTESGRVYKAIKEGTVLPDNPTNGDMIKAMFNDFENYLLLNVISNAWWNSPYKGGQDGES